MSINDVCNGSCDEALKVCQSDPKSVLRCANAYEQCKIAARIPKGSACMGLRELQGMCPFECRMNRDVGCAVSSACQTTCNICPRK